MKEYNHLKIEKKWQADWQKNNLYKTKESTKEKCFVLDMFPYPSGEGLHVGHPRGYIATDVYSRMKKMQGFNILHPMGWDAFGLPAENYAIKNKIHPEQAVKKNIKRYKEQLSALGFNYDWSREINTTDPEYYKWTQWIFLQLYKKGLAFESFEPINWCPSCQTGLANEDLEDGKCERCGSEIEKKPMRQWVLKITDYADRLLTDLEALDWPESIKEAQRNWIGKSEGLLFTAPVKGMDLKIQTFSTHFEAFYADTFVVIAPDHKLLTELVKGTAQEKEVLIFAEKLAKKKIKNGYNIETEPEGIFTGRYIVDPITRNDLPIWVANYVLADYGTGIVKASCHDERDFAFAKKYKIRLKPVLFPQDENTRTQVENLDICFTDMKGGVLSEPKEFSGEIAEKVRDKIADFAVKNGFAIKQNSYRLRDWVFSRQRYWGEPIPMIHCKKCKLVPVPEKDLPVKLPVVKSYEPTGTGESPLAGIDKWVNVKCPICKGPAKRETNTMPQWAGSSWYYLRYMDPTNSKKLVDPKKEKYWSGSNEIGDGGVDMYVGGSEHATRHLIYARFWHKFLYDIGAVTTSEPFKRIGKNLGLILGEDGRKMSKRWGNVVNPDEVVKIYGADTLRVYEMFMGPFNQEIAWDTKSMIGSRRFLEKVWRLQTKVSKEKTSEDISVILNQTIKKVGEDIESFNFNTAISALMILVNSLEKLTTLNNKDYQTLLQLLHPFAPHLTEELWQTLGFSAKSIYLSSWPAFKSDKLTSQEVKVVVQVGGKVRGVVVVAPNTSEQEVLDKVKEDSKLAKYVDLEQIKKVVFIPNKIINLVV